MQKDKTPLTGEKSVKNKIKLRPGFSPADNAVTDDDMTEPEVDGSTNVTPIRPLNLAAAASPMPPNGEGSSAQHAAEAAPSPAPEGPISSRLRSRKPPGYYKE